MRGNPPGRHARVARSLALLLLTAATGLACGGDSGVNPSADDARTALEAALTGWRDGKTPADMANAPVPVHVVDTEWTNGRKLAAFEILREEPSEADKRFIVKLVSPPPAKVKEEEVLYIVLGAETKSVYRSEDFERTMNMDNNPVPKKKRR